MLDIDLQPFAVEFGAKFCLTFHRTLRIPDDGREYPLPPGFGAFPLLNCERIDSFPVIPAEMQINILLPMYQREALWLGFATKSGTHFALKVGTGMINAITGAPFDFQLRDDPQDYLICPEQLWLDGFKTETGIIRQFVAMPLGAGYTVEKSLSGVEQIGGIQVAVFAGRRGAFPEQPQPEKPQGPVPFASIQRMGLGAGGRMRQKIYLDPYGLNAWDVSQSSAIQVVIVNSSQYEQITGRKPPPSPIDARTYTEHGLPWFDLYDEEARDVPASASLGGVATIADRDRELGVTDTGDAAVDVDPDQIKILRPPLEGSAKNPAAPE